MLTTAEKSLTQRTGVLGSGVSLYVKLMKFENPNKRRLRTRMECMYSTLCSGPYKAPELVARFPEAG